MFSLQRGEPYLYKIRHRVVFAKLMIFEILQKAFRMSWQIIFFYVYKKVEIDIKLKEIILTLQCLELLSGGGAGGKSYNVFIPWGRD